jgi:hypothetical protein
VLGASGITASSFAVAAREWVPKSYSEIPRDDIEKLVIEKGTSKVELDRSAPPAPAAGSGSGSGSGSDSGSAAGVGSGAAAPAPAWRIAIDGAPVTPGAHEKVDDYAIAGMLGNVSSIEAHPADPKRDASKPTAIVTVTRKGGATIVFDVVIDGEQYWIKQRGIDRATQIDKGRFEQVLQADRGKLIAKTDPPPGAGSGSGSAGGRGVGAPIVPRPPQLP